MSQDAPIEADALVAFRAVNARSYRDEVELSLQATRFSNPEVVRGVRTAAAAPVDVLPVAGVFGANASGKSTILGAVSDMRRLVRTSFRDGSKGTPISRAPFLLDRESEARPTSYEVEVILKGVLWRYGFEVDDTRVRSEYATYYPKGRPALVFERENEDVTFGPTFRSTGRATRQLLRDNALLLSTVGAANEEQIAPLFHWFRSNLALADSGSRRERSVLTGAFAQDPDNHARVLELLRAADLGLTDMAVVEPDEDTVARFGRAVRVLRDDASESELSPLERAAIDLAVHEIHLSHVAKGGALPLDPSHESLGTQVWVGLIGPLLQALDEGSVLLVDELDASLHPLLVLQFVRLFQDPATNPRLAQLVFNAHDISLLDMDSPYELGRDQIWLTEKQPDSATAIYSLADFRRRKDEAFSRRYLRGRYGAIPQLTPSSFERAVRGEKARA